MDGLEGAVITRGRYSVENIDYLSNDDWYLVQTNQDHFEGTCLSRCQKAQETLNEIGPDNINEELFRERIMLQYPTLNSYTIFSAEMIPSQGALTARLVNNGKPVHDWYGEDKEISQ